jgi:trk system potassium uptake protein TrkA
MKLVIIGAGKVAYYLIRELTHEHEITIIEQDELSATKIANQLSVVVIKGDGTIPSVLGPACEDADMLIALTGKDENNLIACQVAKKHFGVPLTIARVNNPRNLEVMERFGVDKSYSGTKILAEMIEQEIDHLGLRIVHRIKKSDKVLIEFTLSPTSKACEKALENYTFINDSKVVVITTTDGKVVAPRGSTVMHGGELMMMVCSYKYVEPIWKEMVKS